MRKGYALNSEGDEGDYDIDKHKSDCEDSDESSVSVLNAVAQ
jgi:hypothetical protein